MDYAAFERFAREQWDTIPAAYREGVDGLVIDRATHRHPEHADVYTMGECITEEYPSQYGGPDTTRSAVVLYYGSFREIARDEEGFDWEGEIHETIMHELQHHLESLATEAGLEDFDYAVDENFKRAQGDPFDPLFYRAGEVVEPGVFAVEADVFFEIETRDAAATTFRFGLDDAEYDVVLPASQADVCYVYVDGLPDPDGGDVCVVRVMKRGAFATVRAAFGGGTSVEEARARAKVVS